MPVFDATALSYKMRGLNKAPSSENIQYELSKQNLSENVSEDTQQIKDLNASIASWKQEREALVTKLEQARQKLAALDTEAPTFSDEDQDALEEQRLRAGAEAYMEYDPDTAYRWLQQADNIKARRDIASENLQAKKEKEASESDINSIENIKQLAIQYRANMAQRMSPNWNNFDPNDKKQITADIKGIRNQLIKTDLGRALIGEVDGENGGVPVGEAGSPGDKTDISDLNTKIGNAVDKTGPRGKPDGIADNAVAISAALKKLETKYSATDPDLAALKASWETVQNILSTARVQSEAARTEAKTDYETRSKLEAEYGNLIDGIKKLQSDPSSVSNKSNLINSVMRKLSGAAISPSEYADKIRDNLSPADFKAFQNEVQALGVGWSVVLPPETVRRIIDPIAFRYLEKVDPSKIISSANALIDPRVRVKAAKGSGAKEKPIRSNYKSISDYLAALDTWNKGQ